ncbi:MAG: hypothetical protein NTX27_18555 [Verrucomicrobia bacterium]|nr:hypothetical protein [Verrucomicrobiota bacterium]
MHCKLECLPGFEFLKSCCFADSASASPKACEGDGCGAVEDGGYRAEEPTVLVPAPPLVVVLASPVIEAPIPERQSHSFTATRAPPELPELWRFSQRAALPVRAPSFAS